MNFYFLIIFLLIKSNQSVAMTNMGYNMGFYGAFNFITC